MADRREPKSKYTADRLIPGAFEGETVPRRRLMGGGANLAGAAAASAFLLPALAFSLGPVFEKQDQPWNIVGRPGDFPDNTYIPKVITLNPSVGEVGKTTV